MRASFSTPLRASRTDICEEPEAGASVGREGSSAGVGVVGSSPSDWGVLVEGLKGGEDGVVGLRERVGERDGSLPS